MAQSSQSQQQVPALTEALKQLFRARGLPQRVIAEKLGVTPRTVKRWLTGKGLTLQVVEKLCDLLGMTFIEFCEIAKDDLDVRPKRLSPQQERMLLADPHLTFVFNLLMRGWSAQEIQGETGMSKATLVGYLVRLEKLGMIELMPENRVRLLFSRNVRLASSATAAARPFNSKMKFLFKVHKCLASDRNVKEMRCPVGANTDNEAGCSSTDNFGRTENLLKF